MVLWAALLLLATYALVRSLATLKSLRNIYHYKAFVLPCDATDYATPRIWANFQRLLHPVACLSYRDPQFQLPPDLHCLLLLEYACVLLVCDYAAELVQPCEEQLSVLQAAVAAGIALAVTVSVDMSVERVFVRSLNTANKRGEEYIVEEGRTVNTVPMEVDLSSLIQSPSSLLKSTGHRPFPGDSSSVQPPPSSVDLILLLLLMSLAGCSLWGIYLSSRVQTQPIWIHWGIGLALDLPFRIGLALIFGAFGGLTDPCKRYKRFGYQLRWKDLGQYRRAPRKAETSVDCLEVQEVNAEVPDITEEVLDIQEEVLNVTEEVPDVTQEVSKFNEKMLDITEEVPCPSSASDTQRQSLSALSRTLNSAAFSSESLPFAPQETPKPLLHSPSLPVTSRETQFPPMDPLSLPTAREEICPTPLPPVSTPEAVSVLPVFDEFPIPLHPDRFSDIEGSASDFEEPQIPASPVLELRRPRRSASLIEALYGKPGMFGRGGPIATLRQSRTRSPKRPPRSRPLAAILSENEEEMKPNRPSSPEAAESTRYQTPASPILAQHQPPWAETSPRPAQYQPESRVFEPGRPLPPIVPDTEVCLRPDSPEGEGQRVAFGGAVRQSKSQTRLRSRSRVPRRTEDYYDSPYQEILWRRLPAEGRRRVLPVLENGQLETRTRPWY